MVMMDMTTTNMMMMMTIFGCCGDMLGCRLVCCGVMWVGGWLLSNQSGHHFVPSHYHPGHLGHLGQNDNDDDHIHNCHHDGGHHHHDFMS